MVDHFQNQIANETCPYHFNRIKYCNRIITRAKTCVQFFRNPKNGHKLTVRKVFNNFIMPISINKNQNDLHHPKPRRA